MKCSRRVRGAGGTRCRALVLCSGDEPDLESRLADLQHTTGEVPKWS
jgi:hypothetical protein